MYKNTQPATALLIIFGLATALILSAWFAQPEENIWPVLAIIAVVTVLFSSLTIKVDETQIRWHFGPGFWRKSLKLEEIDSTSVIATKWYYGLGIRLTSTGWLYNVSGLTAVQLKLKDGTTLCLGTNDAERLLHAIENASSVNANVKRQD